VFHRYLSDEFVTKLLSEPFWQNVVANPALQPEIRHDAITIYCRGSGLIRDLRLDGNRWVAWTHPKFVPVKAQHAQRIELHCDDAQGLMFASAPTPLPPANMSVDTIAAYEPRLPKRLEDVLKDAIIRHSGNTILDQEVAFADSQSERDRVDLCVCLPEKNSLALIEIKRIHDKRLVERNGVVEVISQLAAYKTRLQNQRKELLEAYQEVVRLKRRLGLGNRLKSVPEDGPAEILMKPILLIGGCSDSQVDDIKARRGAWAPLIQGLPEVSAELILCGESCRLVTGNYRHTLCFD